MDQFNRSFSYLTDIRSKKKVGMFFWLWIGQPYASGEYDAGKILERKNGRKLLFEESSDISPDGQQHFWGEPLWGYYNSADEWVIRKQIELLMLAGVDFIMFDATNAITYQNVYEKVLQVIEEYIGAGWNPPRAAFYTHSYSMQTALQLYHDLYEPRKFKQTWYCEEGKPVIIAYTDPAEDQAWAEKEMKDTRYQPPEYPQEMKDLFCFKRPQWPTDPFLEDGFPWIEWTWPQPVHQNVMSVSVASHPNVPFSFSLTRGLENWGRGWDVDANVNRSADVDMGTFFQSQWDHALVMDPDTVFVGGWNEWIAYKQLWDGEYMLCDAVNKEYSRDIEPMRGGYQDAFYIQLIENIRQYKGKQESTQNNPDSQIRYRSTDCCSAGRNFYGVSQATRYCQKAADNTINEAVLSDSEDNLMVTVSFHKEITEGQLQKLNLFFGIGEIHAGPWESYDYRVGFEENGECCLYRLSDSRIVCVLNDQCEGKGVRIVIPRKKLSRNSNQIYFKAAFDVDNQKDIMSYYTSGSVLPPGRLSYIYPFGR